jgi:hypothetical protein
MSDKAIKVVNTDNQTNPFNVNIANEGQIFKHRKNGLIKKFWLVLIGKDLYYFKSLDKDKLKGMHNLTDSFISEAELTRLDDNEAYRFTIYLKKERTYICKTKKDAVSWVNYIKKALNQREITLDYYFLNTIGGGGFGQVKLAVHRSSGITNAIKIFDINKFSEVNLERAILERDMLKQLKHKNILTYIDSYEDRNYIYLVIEYLQYDLVSYLTSDNIVLNENRIRNIIKQIAEGVRDIYMIMALFIET